MDTNRNLLHEWESIMRRIESIDARLWQGAGIILVVSIGGISLIGGILSKTMMELVIVIVIGLVSLAILTIWWFIFHRWIYLQGVYSYRAREIEEILDLRFNTYARLTEYWGTEEVTGLGSRLHQKDPEAYSALQKFILKQKKECFVHRTIRTSLKCLTFVLASAWIIYMILNGLFYCLKFQ